MTLMTRLGVLASCAFFMVACKQTDEIDLREWMRQQATGLVGKVEPLPEIKPFPVVSYRVAGRQDPFASSRVEPAIQETTVTGGPDMDRRREPLEAHALESLSMVGVLRRDGAAQALITAGGVLHQVRVGNYMGFDHGIVTGIEDTSVSLVELVQDVNGNWVERPNQLFLQER